MRLWGRVINNADELFTEQVFLVSLSDKIQSRSTSCRILDLHYPRYPIPLVPIDQNSVRDKNPRLQGVQTQTLR